MPVRGFQSRQRARLGAAVAILLAAPITFTKDGPSFTDASACTADTGTCCYQTPAVCVIGEVVIWSHFYQKEGPCPQT